MSLPLAPPPGLPLPTFDATEQASWAQKLQVSEDLPLVPILVLALLFGLLAFSLWKYLLPKERKPLTWQEEWIDPFIGEPSAPLTTTEILTKVFEKDPHLAEKVEPLLQEMDLQQFSLQEGNLEPLIEKAKAYFIAIKPVKGE